MPHMVLDLIGQAKHRDRQEIDPGGEPFSCRVFNEHDRMMVHHILLYRLSSHVSLRELDGTLSIACENPLSDAHHHRGSVLDALLEADSSSVSRPSSRRARCRLGHSVCDYSVVHVLYEGSTSHTLNLPHENPFVNT
jgi:hypothetical protein